VEDTSTVAAAFTPMVVAVDKMPKQFQDKFVRYVSTGKK